MVEPELGIGSGESPVDRSFVVFLFAFPLKPFVSIPGPALFVESCTALKRVAHQPLPCSAISTRR